ncbi:hypothetical protein EC991_010660 [Linnemannia zychae]|nr:hypothetical protein EC991_010660 [Linnemannia zychae]
MSCIWECTSFLATVNTQCQNINHVDIYTTVPTIGKDPVMDTCLCKQSLISNMHDCALCQYNNKIVSTDRTWEYINACNQSYPERRLFLSAANAGLKPVSKAGLMVVVMVAVSVVTGTLFG